MAKKEYIEGPAGEKEKFALNIMNIAVEPGRKSTRVEKGPTIAKENMSSLELDEGASIKAFNDGKGRDD